MTLFAAVLLKYKYINCRCTKREQTKSICINFHLKNYASIWQTVRYRNIQIIEQYSRMILYYNKEKRKMLTFDFFNSQTNFFYIIERKLMPFFMSANLRPFSSMLFKTLPKSSARISNFIKSFHSP